MSQFRFARAGLLLAAIGLSTVPVMVGLTNVAYAEAMRAEIGKPLSDAGALMKAKKYKEALSKIREAEGVSNKTPAEALIIERTKASAAQAAGDYDVAAKAYEAVLASGKVTGSEAANINKALVSMYFSTKSWPMAIATLNRQLKDGDNAETRGYLIQAYYQSGDFAKLKTEVMASVNASEKAGRAPSEDTLNMLATIALKQGDKAGYVNAIEKTVANYPSARGWADLLSRVQSKPGFADRLALDVYRLKLATGGLKSAADFMEMSQLALQAGAPGEALKFIDQAYKAGIFGNGAEADRQKRLKDLATKNATDMLAGAANVETEATKNKDGNTLANLGYGLVAAGQTDKGLNMMGQAIKDGNVKRLDDAKLHLGIALVSSGKKADAIKMFKTVQGTDGTADLARYWLLHLKSL